MVEKMRYAVDVVGEKERESLVDDILTRGVSEVIENSPGDLRRRLLTEKLRVKFGTDPTSPNIHYGRAVPLLKLRDFQRLGHQVVLIIGDSTGEVGDTSDKESGRPMLTRKQVEANMQTYVDQVARILDISKVEIHHNSEWLAKLTLPEFSRLADLFTLNEFASREIIRERTKAGKHVSVRELLYPLMQGYDSFAVRADLEIGGDDQRFNLLAGRVILEHFKMERQAILMMHLILGIDGRKMSSSWGNTINIKDTADDIYGKVMSCRDEVMIEYFIHCTRVPVSEIEGIKVRLIAGKVNPKDVKQLLARTMTSQIYGEKAAVDAEANFVKVFAKREQPEEIREVTIEGSRKIVEVMVTSGVASSKSEARRLLAQKGVKVDGVVVSGEDFEVPQEVVLQKGPRVFVKIK